LNKDWSGGRFSFVFVYRSWWNKIFIGKDSNRLNFDNGRVATFWLGVNMAAFLSRSAIARFLMFSAVASGAMASDIIVTDRP
jgi:hypothetical protein